MLRTLTPSILLASAHLSGCRAEPSPAVAPSPPASASTGGTGTFLLLSDMHFDPFLDPTIVPKLVAAEARDWHAIFQAALEAAPNPTLSGRGEDTNYALFASALDAAAAGAKPDFIVIPGDFMAHKFQASYARTSGREATPDRLIAFTTKTLAFIALEIAERFPDAPVFPAVGNNDSGEGDYILQPKGAFFAAAARVFEPLANRKGGAPSFAADFAAGGHFVARLPIERPTSLVVMNSVAWSERRRGSSCTADPADLGTMEVAWLTRALGEVSAVHGSAWLATHIPPGVDVPTTTAASTTCPLKLTSFYSEACNKAVLDVFSANAGTISLSLGGHTHADDFRLFPVASGKPIPHKVSPSLSPIFGNAPGFVTMTFDRATGAIRDYTLTTLVSGGEPRKPAPGTWRKAYDFDEAYQQAAFSSESVAAVASAIRAKGARQDGYVRWYNLGGFANAIAPATTRAYACAITSSTGEAFSACVCDP